MMDCLKFKKKGSLGIFLLFLIPVIDRVNRHYSNMNIELLMGILLILCILGLYLALPYAKCLSDFNKKGKL